MSAPKDNLFRGLIGGVELRDDEPDADDGEEGGDGDSTVAGTTMVGHFAVFNEWTEICSWYEGEFLERLMPGSFSKTIAESLSRVKVQFDHGYDTFVGGAALGPIDTLTQDDVGVYYEVPLLDTDYNRDRLLPMLQGRLLSGEQRGSVLGASFRFRVVRDEWNYEPGVSAYNPENLPERTIREVELFEFGPVVFPAYPSATAGMRSLTDHYLDRLRESRSGAARKGTPVASHDAPPAGHPSTGHRDPRRLSMQAALAALR